MTTLRQRIEFLNVPGLTDALAEVPAPGTIFTPPKEFRLFRAGVNPSTKGAFLFDKKSQQSVMALARMWANRFPFDFNHSMLAPDGPNPAEQKKAAGRFTPEIRNGELWATNIFWTRYATEKLNEGEYAYFSPAFNVDQDERVVELTNCALTNLPAMHDIEALIAASLSFPTLRARSPNTRSMTMSKAELKKAIHARHAKFHGKMHDELARKSLDSKMDEMSMDELSKYLKKLDGFGGDSEVSADDAEADSKHGLAPAEMDEESKKHDDADADADASKKHDDSDADAAASKKADDGDADDAAAAKRSKRAKSKVASSEVDEDRPGANSRVMLDRIAQLEAEVASSKAERVAERRSVMLERAKLEGKLTPADIAGKGERGAFLKTLSNSQLEMYIASAKPVVRTSDEGTREPSVADAGVPIVQVNGKPVTLSVAEADMCRRTGTDVEAFAKTKAELLSKATARQAS